MDKAIITVVGKDTVGILAKTCTCLAENGVNILDISQTVRSDYFNMMMIVDVSRCAKPFADLGADLAPASASRSSARRPRSLRRCTGSERHDQHFRSP